MKHIAYYRVSTQRQGNSGLGLEAQEATVKQAVKDGEIVASYQEIESGRNCKRPQLAKALVHARMAKATLVVAKLDRMARDARFLLGLVDSGVPILFGDLPELSTGDPIVGRLTLTVLAAIAEFEAKRISQRVREAMKAFKARGGKLGSQDPRCPGFLRGDRRGTQAAKEANQRAAREWRDSARIVVQEFLDRHGTLAAAAEQLNLTGHRTRRGKPWTLATVWAVLKGAS